MLTASAGKQLLVRQSWGGLHRVSMQQASLTSGCDVALLVAVPFSRECEIFLVLLGQTEKWNNGFEAYIGSHIFARWCFQCGLLWAIGLPPSSHLCWCPCWDAGPLQHVPVGAQHHSIPWPPMGADLLPSYCPAFLLPLLRLRHVCPLSSLIQQDQPLVLNN